MREGEGGREGEREGGGREGGREGEEGAGALRVTWHLRPHRAHVRDRRQSTKSGRCCGKRWYAFYGETSVAEKCMERALAARTELFWRASRAFNLNKWKGSSWDLTRATRSRSRWKGRGLIATNELTIYSRATRREMRLDRD